MLGYPLKFFIDGVDIDFYCRRARKSQVTIQLRGASKLSRDSKGLPD